MQNSFFENLEAGVEIKTDDLLSEEYDFGGLDSIHHALWLKEKDKHVELTKEICGFRKQSLETSHQGRVSIISDQIVNATNDKIRRMREAQLNNTNADYDRKIKELRDAESLSDIHARPVVFGVVRVENENGN